MMDNARAEHGPIRTLRSDRFQSYGAAMAPTTVAPPDHVRVALSPGRWCPDFVTVVHIGQSALVWVDAGDPRRLVTVTSPGRGLAPGGICLPGSAAFETLRRAVLAANAARTGPGTGFGPVLDLAGWSLLPESSVERVDLSLSPRAVSVSALAAFRAALEAADTDAIAAPSGEPRGDRRDPVMNPAPLRALAAPLASAALAGDADAVAALSGALVGAGPGATPTGDDTIVGVLAALATARGTLPGDVARAAASLLADQVRPLLGRTTTASGHDVAAALDGLFAERVHALAAGATDVALVPDAVASARAWGATSGIDLATAICAGLTATQEFGALRPGGGNPTLASVATPPPTHRRSA